jgi:hypothetical protein
MQMLNMENHHNEFFDLDYEWRTLAIVEGGEALIRLAEDSPWIEVSLPQAALEERRSDDEYIIELLENKGIEVDKSIAPNYANGPSDGEVIATFCLETSGQL